MTRYLLLAAALMAAGPVGAVRIDVVALSTDPAPGMTVPFTRFEAPAYGGGVTSFRGDVGGRRGVFRDAGANAELELVAITGLDAPRTYVDPFTRVLAPHQNAEGETEFAGAVDTASGPEGGVFRAGDDGVQAIVLDSTSPVPAPPPIRYRRTTITRVVIGTGQQLDDVQSDAGVYSIASRPPAVLFDSDDGLGVVRDGDGTIVEWSLPEVSRSGDSIAFVGHPRERFNPRVVRLSSSGLEYLAEAGDAVPDTNGVQLDGSFEALVQGSDATVFVASDDERYLPYWDPRARQRNLDNVRSRKGLYREAGFGLELIALEGQVVPDSAGLTLREFHGVAYDAGTTAFVGALAAVSDDGRTTRPDAAEFGVFRDTGDGLERVAVGTEGISDIGVTGAGQLVLSRSTSALYTVDVSGDAVALLSRGDYLAVTPEDQRQILDLYFDAERGVGADGIAASASFTDGTFAVLSFDFSSNGAALVPEPASVTLAMAGLAGFLAFSRRRGSQRAPER